MATLTPYRLVRADYDGFGSDFVEGAGEREVDREGLLQALRDFAKANDLKIDWDDVKSASNETLVNSLAVMSPYGAREKQALLEAKDLKSRADFLIAIAQFDLAGGAPGAAQPQLGKLKTDAQFPLRLVVDAAGTRPTENS